MNAQHIRHIHLDDAVSVQPKRARAKHRQARPRRYGHKHKASKTTEKHRSRHQRKASSLYKQGKHAVFAPPFSSKQIIKTKRLMKRNQFRNGVQHELNYLVGTWDYSKRGVRAHSHYFMSNYYRYLNGDYHFRMGYLAGTNASYSSPREDNEISNAKHDRSFWKGFYTGLYNSYGYRADRKTAKEEFQSFGKLFDDVAPPYSR